MKRNTSSGQRILIVNDSQTVSELMEDVLCEEGYSVHTTNSGYPMLFSINKGRPELILLDTGRYLTEVIPTLHLLKEAGYTDIPIILTTTDSKASFVACEELHEAVQGLSIHRVITFPMEDIGVLTRYVRPFCRPGYSVPSWADTSYQSSKRPQSPSGSKKAGYARVNQPVSTVSGSQNADVLNSPTNTARWYLALALVVLVGASGIGALTMPNGMAVFEKILPALMFAIGYFFNKQ